MKRKILAALFAAILTFTACGCGSNANTSTSVTNSKVSSSKGNENLEEIKEITLSKAAESADVAPKLLNNSLYKLKNEKKLTVGFFGGSITHGVGATDNNVTSWRALTTQWFRDSYPDAEITDVNACISGTGSLYGTFRIQKDLLEKNPDLVFVEFSLNDAYQSNTPEESNYFMECVIKQIYEVNPKADIIFVFTTDQNYFGGDNDWKTAQTELARHYGIPTIDVGAALREQIGSDGDKWKEYLSDWVHPADKGHAVYAKAANEFLADLFGKSTPESKNQELPEPMFENLILKGNYRNFSEDTVKNYSDWKFHEDKQYWGSVPGVIYSTKSGAEVEMEFEGDFLCAFVQYDTSAAQEVQFIVDNKYVRNCSFKWNTLQTQTIPVINGLGAGKHTLKIVNRSGKKCAIAQLFEG